MKKSCIAMLLAGGQGSRLYALTQDVAKPNMPFGGKYRIIDFPLSNCANSGIDTVGVLTQYRPLQLNSYIGGGQPWDLDSTDGGVFILPPYQTAGETGSWFSGTRSFAYSTMIGCLPWRTISYAASQADWPPPKKTTLSPTGYFSRRS